MKIWQIIIIILLSACKNGSEPDPPIIQIQPFVAVPPPPQEPIATVAPTSFIDYCNITNGVIGSGRLGVTPLERSVLIVAVGSSSTEGIGASTPEKSYPAFMQSFLNKNTKNVTFIVVNKGVSGDTIAGIEARLDRDVLSKQPQVVLLQTGLSDALSGSSTADYYSGLTRVVKKLKKNSSVILMNSQLYPGEPSNHLGILAILNTVAAEQNVPIVDRYGIFSNAINKNVVKIEDILASDKMHNNDLGYQCMGKISAELIIIATN